MAYHSLCEERSFVARGAPPRFLKEAGKGRGKAKKRLGQKSRRAFCAAAHADIFFGRAGISG
jgi:hypothetical protein